MKYFISIIALITFLNAQAICELEGRKELKFGMTSLEVQSLGLDWTSKEVQEIEGDYIGAEHLTSFGLNKADGFCSFKNDKLNAIIYSFKLNTTNDNKYVNTYFDLKNNLIKKYGEPEIVNEYLESPYDEQPLNGDRAGSALALGRGKYISRWSCETNQVSIMLLMHGDNYQIKLTLYYADDQYKKPKKQQETELLDDF